MIDKLQVPILMLVTDRKLAGGVDALVRAVAAAVDGGAHAVQLREKDLAPAELLPLARRLREVTAGRALLLVNGPLEVAVETGADGVHLPEDTAMIERTAPGFVVGRSVHSLEAARRASDEGVDYVVAGPVYSTRSHPEAPAAGIELVSRIAAALPVPVIAIGGITADRTPEVIRAGAAGVAVISAILGAEKPPGAAREIAETLREAWPGTRGAEVGGLTTITLNGKQHALDRQITVTGLLASLNISPKQVAVAVNGEVVPRDTWTDANVAEGDAVEIVRAVGGG